MTRQEKIKAAEEAIKELNSNTDDWKENNDCFIQFQKGPRGAPWGPVGPRGAPRCLGEEPPSFLEGVGCRAAEPLPQGHARLF